MICDRCQQPSEELTEFEFRDEYQQLCNRCRPFVPFLRLGETHSPLCEIDLKWFAPVPGSLAPISKDEVTHA